MLVILWLFRTAKKVNFLGDSSWPYDGYNLMALLVEVGDKIFVAGHVKGPGKVKVRVNDGSFWDNSGFVRFKIIKK